MHEPLTRHDRRRERTRKQLQDALLGLLLERSFEALVVQEISDAADVGRGTFYFHFDSKEEVLWSIVEERFPFAQGQAASLFKDGLPAQPEFYLYVNRFKEFEKFKTVFLAVLGRNGSQAVSSRVRDALAAELVREMENYPLYRGFGQPVDISAQIVTGLMLHLAVWWLENPNHLTAVQMGGILYQTLHHQEAPGGSWLGNSSA